MILSGNAYRRLEAALSDAFRSEEEFDGLARDLGWRLTDLVGEGSAVPRIVRKLVERAEQHEDVRLLIQVAQEVNPNNRLLGELTYASLIAQADHRRQVQRIALGLQMRVRQALLDAFPDDAELTDLVVTADRRGAASLDEASSTGDSLLRCVGAAARDGWLVALVEEAHVRAPDADALQALLDELNITAAAATSSQEPWERAIERCLLNGGFFMINRRGLRDSMGLMLPDEGNRVLVVRGNAQSGLSHSLRLLYHLSEPCGLTIVELDLEVLSRRMGPRRLLSPYDIALDLVKLLEYKESLLPAHPSDKQWSAWTVEFVQNFALRAAKDERRLFLVLDALHKVQLTQPTSDLVQALSSCVAMTLPRYRMVLVGYWKELPPRIRQAMLLDKTADLTRDDLAAFFEKAYRERNVSIDAPTIVQKVVNVLPDAEAASAGTLVDLADRVYRELPKAANR